MSDPKKRLLDPLFCRHAAELQGFARRRAGVQEAQDIVQATYVRWAEHPSPESLRDPRAYLFTIAANLVRDAERRAERETARLEHVIDFDRLPSATPGPDIAAEAAECFERFEAALAELPELGRHAFLLNRFRGLGHRQIALRLGLSKKTVERYILQASLHCAARLAE